MRSHYLRCLQKHLIHLKAVQQLDEIPRTLGLPPVENSVLQRALTSTSIAIEADHMGAVAAHHGHAGEGSGRPMSFSLPRFSFGGAAASGDVDANPLAGMGFSDQE